ncbi:hypothetical protein [Ferrimonas senticii]|uniref:baseplate complex protein n=1 Tax=Ferrimonas senticii TaxID=394566 RepID=UPI0004194D78|nr:hypothetical protein [Ferrimonas senticii]
MSVQLTLDGEAVHLDNLTVSVSANFADEDASGKSSQAITAETGTKPVELKVTGRLSYTNERQAVRLVELSRQKATDGSRHAFRIGNATARVVKCRLAKFAGQLSLTEQTTLHAWQVSFTLREVKSVAEQQEQRSQNTQAFDQALAQSEGASL